jgi:hypothetical protein
MQQKLLIGAALSGADTLCLTAISVHFRPAAAYGIATVATLLLWLAFWPLVAIITQETIIHRTLLSPGYSDLFAPVAAFSDYRCRGPARSRVTSGWSRGPLYRDRNILYQDFSGVLNCQNYPAGRHLSSLTVSRA